MRRRQVVGLRERDFVNNLYRMRLWHVRTVRCRILLRLLLRYIPAVHWAGQLSKLLCRDVLCRTEFHDMHKLHCRKISIKLGRYKLCRLSCRVFHRQHGAGRLRRLCCGVLRWL